jgi:DNA-binding NarL/FixJ family response regulator
MSAIRVLLVDDSEAFLEAATKFLQALAGVEVVARAASGAEALTQAEALKPDLILLDVVMPGMSGIEAARLVRQGDHAPKVVVLTLHNTDAYRDCAARAGADGFVAKDDLVAKLPALIGTLFPGSQP